MTDQKGTVHAYQFDKLGRPTDDQVTTLGTGVDGAVRRISRTYEVRGLPYQVTSYDAATSGSVVNQIQYVYNDFGQATKEYQEHGGAVNTGTTPSVGYSYEDGSANTVRPTGITYPNGRELTYAYASGTDDALSRITSIDDAGPAVRVTYTYLGLTTFVRADYPEPQIRWDLITGSGANPYAGLDQFGRVIDCLWRNYGDSEDTERVLYGYDRASNRIWRHNAVAPDGGNDELYSYDGMQRLIDMNRGDLVDGNTAIDNQSFAQQWNLDATGNWSGFVNTDVEA